jgi:hypothetical protein
VLRQRNAPGPFVGVLVQERRVSEYVYTPSPWGEIFHNYDGVDEMLGAGSAGPGKTEVLINDANPQIFVEHERCEKAKDHPYPLKWGQSQGWALHLRRMMPQLLPTMERCRRIFQQIDPKARWYGSENMWEFSSGYKFQFGHCKDPDDWENYEGNAYTHIGFDELVQFMPYQYHRIRARCRSADPVLMRMLKTRSMSNPLIQRMSNEKFVQRDPHWVRERFVDPAPTGKKLIRERIIMMDGTEEWHTRMYLPAKLYDNPNKEFCRQYEKNLQSQKPHIRRALLEGDWYGTADSFYGDSWNPNVHVCRPFRIPDSWPRFRSMDWGYKHPGCVHWWALDEDDNLFMFRELTFREKTDIEVAKMVLEIELGMGLVKGGRSVLTGPADTQLWEERGEHHGLTKAAAMASKGVYWTKADKPRRHNAERLVKRLKDHDRGRMTPGFVVFNTCKDFIRTIRTIQTEPDDHDCPAQGGDDHWHDSSLFAVAYASRGRIGMPKPIVPEHGDEHRKPVIEDKRGRTGYGY